MSTCLFSRRRGWGARIRYQWPSAHLWGWPSSLISVIKMDYLAIKINITKQKLLLQRICHQYTKACHIQMVVGPYLCMGPSVVILGSCFTHVLQPPVAFLFIGIHKGGLIIIVKGSLFESYSMCHTITFADWVFFIGCSIRSASGLLIGYFILLADWFMLDLLMWHCPGITLSYMSID